MQRKTAVYQELLHKLDKRIRPNNEYVHTETIKKI